MVVEEDDTEVVATPLVADAEYDTAGVEPEVVDSPIVVDAETEDAAAYYLK